MPDSPPIRPWDAHNQELVSHVHPPDWVAPTPADRYDLVVIGGGTAGLVTAAGSAPLGAKVALVERHMLGGDCLNVGCVPSKTLIRSARAAADAARAGEFGVRIGGAIEVDFGAVMERVRRVRAGIAPHDSAARLKRLGIDVFLGDARFADGHTVLAGPHRLNARHVVIATGARPAVPDVPGLADAQPYTSETIFELTERPARLAVIGGGPIGCELAQAFRRLGSAVTLIHDKDKLLDREDSAAAAIVQEAFRREGVTLVLGGKLERVEVRGTERVLSVRVGEELRELAVDAILVGAGRKPNVDGMALEAAGVEFDRRKGVVVDDYLRTTNPEIFACGDVCMAAKFTHAADFGARLVIQNALFALGPIGRGRVSDLNIPRCTYTDPEIASIGLGESEAKKLGRELDEYRVDLADVDRARTDGETQGFVTIRTAGGSGRIVGATIVARHAGEMIGEIAVAMKGGVGLGKIAGAIHPYPTTAEAIRKCGDLYNKKRLGPQMKRFIEGWIGVRR